MYLLGKTARDISYVHHVFNFCVNKYIIHSYNLGMRRAHQEHHLHVEERFRIAKYSTQM